MFIQLKAKEVKKFYRNKSEMWGYYFSYVNEHNQILKERKGGIKWGKNDAQSALNERIKVLKNSEENTEVNKKKKIVTLEEVFIEFLKAKQASYRHKKRTEYDSKSVAYKHIIPKFTINGKPKPIDKITKKDIELWRNDLTTTTFKIGGKESTYSERQIIKIQNLCKSIFSYAKLHGYIQNNPLDYFEAIRRKPFSEESNTVFTILSNEQHERLMKTIDNHTDKAGKVNELEKLQDLTLFSILFTLGLRLGECLILKASDYNTETKMLSITKNWDYVNNLVTSPKTVNGTRSLLVGDTVHNHIVNLINYYKSVDLYKDDMNIFISLTTAKRRTSQFIISPNTVRRRNDKYLQEARLSHMRIHDYRHSCASHLANNGIDDFTIAQRLGDTVRTVSDVYSHMNIISQKRVVDLFENNKKSIK